MTRRVFTGQSTPHGLTRPQFSNFLPIAIKLPKIHNRCHVIPLPLELEDAVDIHPTLRYNILPSIIYDLNRPPETATLSTQLVSSQLKSWYSQPALIPAEAQSFTMCIEGIDQPIAIVAASGLDPNGPSNGFITIWDVLHHCHLAWTQAKEDSKRILLHHGNRACSTSKSAASLLFSNGISVNMADHCAITEHLMLDNRDVRAGLITKGLDVIIADKLTSQQFLWVGLVPSAVAGDEIWTVKLSSTECCA
ncbi:hypothetical protein BJ165DRAFT_1524934 [Panaeolus papilionaceus]|nr:hypothetical protein BJ165DRAFT_1524934 [Panaeolus papilionaceus]